MHENVAPLAQGALWRQVEEVCLYLGITLSKLVLQLSQVVPMKREKCFMVASREPLPDWRPTQVAFQYDWDAWSLPEGFRAPTLTRAMLEKLAAPELLPPNLRGSSDPLQARVVRELPLPVLMSAYMQQTQLPLNLLKGKGLYTWLIRSGSMLRHFHQAEAARILGFGPSYVFDADPYVPMLALGDSISPIQVLQVMTPLLKAARFPFAMEEVEEPLLVALACLGWPRLSQLALAVAGHSLRFVCAPVPTTGDDGVYCIGPYTRCLELPPWGLSGDQLCNFVQVHLGYNVPVLEVTVDHNDGLIEVTLQDIAVSDRGLPMHPLTPWGTVLEALGFKESMMVTASTRGDVPLWMVEPKRRKQVHLGSQVQATVVTPWQRFPCSSPHSVYFTCQGKLAPTLWTLRYLREDW